VLAVAVGDEDDAARLGGQTIGGHGASRRASSLIVHYGHSLRFGVFITPKATDARKILDLSEKLAEMTEVIDAAAEEAGRDPRTIRRLYNIDTSFDARQLANLYKVAPMVRERVP
jgi:hypothetical protein